MFGISYGEIFLLIGVTAAVVGPKDVPRIARMAGRLTGRSIRYIQLARAQFDTIVQHSQAAKMNKDVQDHLAQIQAIGHEARRVVRINPGPLTQGVSGAPPNSPPGADSNVDVVSEKPEKKPRPSNPSHSLKTAGTTDLHSRATAYGRIAETTDASVSNSEDRNSYVNEHGDQIDISVLPISAENAKLLPARKENANGSDIVLEAIIEADVARKAKDFFSQELPNLTPRD